MLTADTLTATLAPGDDVPTVALGVDLTAPDAPLTRHAVAEGEVVASLLYPSAAAYAARVSADVEALRELPGAAIVESWVPSASDRLVCLRFAPALVVEAPKPIAPATVPASSPRRR